MPTTTDMIEQQLGEGSTYRLFSAVAHGHSWAVHQLGFEEVSDSEIANAAAPYRALTKTVNHPGLIYLVLTAATTFARAVWNQCLYAGWDDERLAAVFTQRFDQLNASDHLRFWH